MCYSLENCFKQIQSFVFTLSTKANLGQFIHFLPNYLPIFQSQETSFQDSENTPTLSELFLMLSPLVRRHFLTTFYGLYFTSYIYTLYNPRHKGIIG